MQPQGKMVSERGKSIAKGPAQRDRGLPDAPPLSAVLAMSRIDTGYWNVQRTDAAVFATDARKIEMICA